MATNESKKPQEANTVKHEPFNFNIEEHQAFSAIMESMYLSSSEFCKTVSGLFRTIFSDFEGCNFEVNQQGLGYIALYFNHNEIDDDTKVKAISRFIPEDQSIHSDTVRRIRSNDSRHRNGDRYYLTTEGKEALEKLVCPQVIGRKGNIDWSKITAEVSQQQAQFNQAPVVYTKVSLIDPTRMATLIYGETDEDGVRWEYGVRILRSTPPMIQNGSYQSSYMLGIDRASEPEVQKLCNVMGVVPSGLNIFR